MFVLWGLMPDDTPVRITEGTPAHCRREQHVREGGTYWRGLRVYSQGTPYPPELIRAARG